MIFKNSKKFRGTPEILSRHKVWEPLCQTDITTAVTVEFTPFQHSSLKKILFAKIKESHSMCGSH